MSAAATKGTRLYKVTTPTSVHLVESPSVSRAIAHVARNQIQAEIPPQFEIFNLAKSGVEIERVGDVPLSDDTRMQIAQPQLGGVPTHAPADQQREPVSA